MENVRLAPEFNVSIEDINATSTTASVSAYGNYEFTYTICDESVSQSVNVEGVIPIISSDALAYTCLNNFDLLVEVDGDPGYWESDGPFLSTFNNITALNPTVSVSGYGTHIFYILWMWCLVAAL